jgi:hypothetical protein
MPKNSKARIDANRRYAEKSYDRLYPFVPKGRKVEIQAEADVQNESLNDFIVKAIDERIERLQRKRDAETPFAPPLGEWCTKNCKKRCGVIYANSDGIEKPWCSLYGKELTDRDETTGEYRKCAECLNEAE